MMLLRWQAHEINCFNLKRSDSLDLNRPVPDYRDRRCLEIKVSLNSAWQKRVEASIR